jgi:hypothetical protein
MTENYYQVDALLNVGKLSGWLLLVKNEKKN